MVECGFARGSSKMFRPRSPHRLLLGSGFMHHSSFTPYFVFIFNPILVFYL